MLEHGGEKGGLARRCPQPVRIEAGQRQKAAETVLVGRDMGDSLDRYGFGFLAVRNAPFRTVSERRLFCG